MSRGGARNGAGRKPKARTEKKRPRADLAAAEGPMPAPMMLAIARHYFQEGRYPEALKAAAECADYYHPKLSTVKVGGDPGNPVPIAFIEVIRAAGGGSDPV